MCRQEQFDKSAAGKAARAQMQAAAKQAAHTNKGEPTLKVQLIFFFKTFLWIMSYTC